MEDRDAGETKTHTVPSLKPPWALFVPETALVRPPWSLAGSWAGDTDGLLFEKLPHGAQRWAPVLPTEVVPVVQVVKELIEQQPPVKPWSLGDLLVVGGEEGPGKPPEHQGNCQFKLRMAVEGGWVINNGPAVILCHIS